MATDGLNILTVVGARPQFIKAAPLSRALRDRGHREFLVHTGQHYDRGMSEIFFEELGIPEPDVNLEIGSGHHGETTGAMLAGLERLCLEQKPDILIVFGDTNSTLAGALAAAKLNIPIAHVEAGLRSFDKSMPEEVNRVLTDHLAALLFCPTETAVTNLGNEGIGGRGVHLVGDLMYDSLLAIRPVAGERSRILEDLELDSGGYHMVTMHRPSNTDDPDLLRRWLEAINQIGPVVFPMHPRCRSRVDASGLGEVLGDHVRVIEPLGYLDLLHLAGNAGTIITDSGGLQKEAYWLEVPCITLREQTEWVETVEAGWNCILGASPEKLPSAVASAGRPADHPDVYGDGDSANQIREILEDFLG